MVEVTTGKRRTRAWLAAAGFWLALAVPAQALFHLATIDELLTSYDGDAEVQFIEIRMLAGSQNIVAHSVIAAFDANGGYIGDVLEVPSNVTMAGANLTWLVGTEAFAAASGVAPDFVMPTGILPTAGGMVCFGGGGGFLPQNPPTWDRTSFATYIDCVAYGAYAGPGNVRIGTPTALTGDGHSLQRMTSTGDNLADFICAEASTPKNNAAATASLPATASCVDLPPCQGDCNEDRAVSIDELVRAVDIALGNAAIDACLAIDANGDESVSIDELIAAVAAALNECDG